ncbi:MAG: PTS transporter subunit EIIC [Selenomonadaceae bacterium]|nr:PTS transporter subunit EIIC [Selenomonadaceae bacterium]
MSEGGSSAFAVAQQIGKSLFLPIAVLPFAGVLLGVGASFSNPTTIAAYGLEAALHPGSALFSFMVILSNVGGAIFGNLPLIFALAVALGMAKKEKGIAVLGAAIFYLVLLTTIHVFLGLDGSIHADGSIDPSVKEGAITSVLGIVTLQMGVFAGIVTGLVAAQLCNKYYKMQLPPAFSFFGGTRFVPIVCMIFGTITGVIMYFVWPIVQTGIFALGGVVQAAGYFGTFFFGCCERALIPFGLHHIFYLPFWQTGLGGTAVIDGQTVMGAQNIFFAELASPNTEHFSVDAARFLMGKFPFMMAGLPAAAFAMYTCARPEKKKAAGSLLFSVGLTSFLTGITEPIEFTFLFLAKELFMIHVFYAGVSFAACHVMGIAMGTTFSDGLIDFILYGVLPGQSKTNWMMMLPLFAVFAILYFITFKFFIMKWDLKTPGREADDEEVKMMSKDEYRKATGVGVAGGGAGSAALSSLTPDQQKSATILGGVGGVDNVTEIDCCATRLRLTLVDGSKVNEAVLKSTGAGGVVIKGNAIQVIYGPSVTIVKANFEEFVEDIRAGKIDRSIVEGASGGSSAAAAEPEKPKMQDAKFGAHLTGRMMLMNEVPDDGFASRAMGDGVAVDPTEGKLLAPSDGTITLIFPTKHAIGMVTPEGAELLMHIGIDTVKLDGQHFEVHVTDGQEVKRGDLLVTFDIDAIKKAGYPVVTPLIVTNSSAYGTVRPLKTGDVKAGTDDLLEVLG